VETEWAKRESKSLLKAQQNIDDSDTNDVESESDDEAEECIVKGRSMALNAFYRIARNTMSMWFKNSEPLAEEVEQEFWKHVTLKQNHICVHSGSIDSGNWGYGFAVSKNSPFARHAWNLKVLTNNSGSVLRSMGPVMGKFKTKLLDILYTSRLVCRCDSTNLARRDGVQFVLLVPRPAQFALDRVFAHRRK
jgi:protein Jumonji